MSPITHFLAGWTVANTANLNRRERMLIALAGIIPDVDGLGAIADLIARNKNNPFQFYQQYHHVFGHNVFFGLLCACLALVLASRKKLVAGLVLLSFHLHLAGDIIGARGLGDDFWPVPYLWPVADLNLVWSRQWPLNGWQNFVITGVLMALMFFLVWKRGYSPVEMLSVKADRGFVGVLRARFGEPAPEKVSVI
jgi:hypothetical protein